MSEIKLNLIDAQHVLHGNIHGFIGDAAVAALSAEPETVAELEAALTRYIKPTSSNSPFAAFQTGQEVDEVPWDAGIVVIDLAARIVAIESSYSQPGQQGEVPYHDGTKSTEVPVLYRLPDDWLFVDSLDEHRALSQQRREQRAASPPLDARAVLYGRPLLEWIVETSSWSALTGQRFGIGDLSPIAGSTDARGDSNLLAPDKATTSPDGQEANRDDAARRVAAIHARWLMTPREDLHGQSPREVLHAKKDFIDFDMHTRQMQWSLRDEGPPCLSIDSFAYRFAGFGTHEWVIYYDLVRHLIWNALPGHGLGQGNISPQPSVPVRTALNITGQHSSILQPDVEMEIARLEWLKNAWLEQPHDDYDGRTPAILIENERKRLPIALSPRDMIVDDNCPTCQMLANDANFGVGFWGLDGSQMDDDFAFSHHRTRQEWETERREWAAFSEKFNREWEEKQARIARGELVEPDAGFIGDDPF